MPRRTGRDPTDARPVAPGSTGPRTPLLRAATLGGPNPGHPLAPTDVPKRGRGDGGHAHRSERGHARLAAGAHRLGDDALSAAAPSSAPLAQAPAARARDAAADRAVTEPNARPVVGASASAGAPPARVDAVPAKARAASGTAAKAPEIAAAARLAARDGAMRPSAAEKATESAKAAETAAGMVIAFPTDGKIAEVPWAVLIGLATLTVLSDALALRMP